jgi:uncharacterized protein (TIGR03435 family)
VLNSAKRPILAQGILAVSAFVIAGHTEPQSESPLAFEVASVKQNKLHAWVRRPWSPNIQCPNGHCGVFGNRFQEEAASLIDLIMDAFSVRRFQVANLPDWGDSGRDVYDIDAKIEGNRTPTLDKARRMLQTLLADRFQLKLHHEKRQVCVYALVIAKNGPKLTPMDDDRENSGLNRRAGTGTGNGIADGERMAFSWASFTEMLTERAGRPVIDRTGLYAPAYCTLDGKFPIWAILSQLAPRGGRGGRILASNDDSASESSIFDVVQKTLGLKLESRTGPVDILIIDHVERPSAN